MSITESSAFKQGYREMQAELARMEPISETMRRWESERYMLRNDPVLAMLLRIEAIAAGRAECHVSEAAKLPAIGDLARQAAEKHTGKPFKNPLFP